MKKGSSGVPKESGLPSGCYVRCRRATRPVRCRRVGEPGSLGCPGLARQKERGDASPWNRRPAFGDRFGVQRGRRQELDRVAHRTAVSLLPPLRGRGVVRDARRCFRVVWGPDFALIAQRLWAALPP